MKNTRKQDIADELGQPIIVVEEKEENLTPKQKKHLDETKIFEPFNLRLF
ncbi:MAG: hypothetical protein WA130_11845 [Candidatus Methanoperedens sp.]